VVCFLLVFAYAEVEIRLDLYNRCAFNLMKEFRLLSNGLRISKGEKECIWQCFMQRISEIPSYIFRGRIRCKIFL
jgi:hypothetical protein